MPDKLLLTLSERAQKDLLSVFMATRIAWVEHGAAGGVDLGPDDLVFMTIGPLTENPDNGDHHTPARRDEGPAPAWDLWRRIARYIEAIAKRDPFSAKLVTAGIVTVKDLAWLLSWTVSRQPQVKQQPNDQVVGWLYGLFVDQPGDAVKKPMQDCTGEDITQECLYRLGVPVEDMVELAATGARTVPVMMPYITAFFMP